MEQPNQITKTDLRTPIVWANQECMWTSVPKNANMAYRRLCRAVDMPKQKYIGQTATYSICVVRNPVHRLFSGLGEFIRRHKQKELPITLLEKLLDNADNFDEHLEPQIVYLQNKSYTHILSFENLVEETLQVPYFAKNEQIVKLCIRQPVPDKSKYFSHSIDEIYKYYSPLIDDIINKYYFKDVILWQNREKYVGQILDYDSITVN